MPSFVRPGGLVRLAPRGVAAQEEARRQLASADFAPRRLRTSLPPRGPEGPGQVFRDFGPLNRVFDSKSSNANPTEIRTDAGIFLQYDMAELLKRHADLIVVDSVESVLSAGGASSTGEVTISFAEDHYIIGAGIRVTANPANFDSFQIRVRPFGDPTVARLAYGVVADLVDAVTESLVPFRQAFALPLFGRRETDYILQLRSTAGGDTSAGFGFLVIMAPEGVEIAH